VLQESRTHYGCSVKHLRPFVTVDAAPDTFAALRRGGRSLHRCACRASRDAPLLYAHVYRNGFVPISGGYPPGFSMVIDSTERSLERARLDARGAK